VSCAQLQLMGKSRSGEYTISPLPDIALTVSCDMDSDGGGWTVIQRRGMYEPAGNNFEKTFKEYEDGFHIIEGHTSTGLASRKVVTSWHMVWFPGGENSIPVTSPFVSYLISLYRITLQIMKIRYSCVYKSSCYDALSSHNGYPFSVKKNGQHSGDRCVSQISGGWWFNGCIHSNLNGWKFKESVPETSKGLGITWYNRNDKSSYFDVYSEVEMKIRDADFEFCMGSLAYEVH
ncbi:ixoderin B, putative, partial [Ixodes scapularis]